MRPGRLEGAKEMWGKEQEQMTTIVVSLVVVVVVYSVAGHDKGIASRN